jgi:hypothetical protein
MLAGSVPASAIGTSVRNGSELPSCGPSWNRPGGPGPGQEPPCNLNQVTSAALLPGPDIYPRVFGWVGTGPRFQLCGSYNFGSN